MALYLGNKKVKIHLSGVVYRLNIMVDISKLLSSDGYILNDINQLRLIAKEE